MSEWIRSNVGHVITIALIIGTAIYGYGMLNANVQLLAREVSYLRSELKNALRTELQNNRQESRSEIKDVRTELQNIRMEFSKLNQNYIDHRATHNQ